MIRVRLAIPLLAGVALAVYSCGEPSSRSRAASLVTAPSFNKTSATCDVRSLISLARSYFAKPEQQTTTDTLNAMRQECAKAEDGQVVAGGWSILSTIDTISAAQTGGPAADGASLANGVIHYMCSNGVADLCAPDTFENSQLAPVTAADLGSTGIFSVRGDDNSAVVAHGPIAFPPGASSPNWALWGVEVAETATWKSATGASTILIYGAPDTLPVLGDASIGNLAFQLYKFPDVSGFTEDGVVHVGVCYKNPITLSDEANVLQRNGTLLQGSTPTFCGLLTNSDLRVGMTSFHGVLDGLLAMAGRAFLPQPLLAATTTTNPPSTGGSPIDFSDFAPVGAGTAGRLQFVTPPVDGVNGNSLPLFTVEALSGGGTQIERVPITLSLTTNNGVPAGASFCNTDGSACSDTTAKTVEGPDGENTVATFTGITIYKAGGYELCANADSVPYVTYDPDGNQQKVFITFQPVCATIHIKNH